MIELSDDARTYYADGFRKSTGGVPCKVFSRRTTDGRYIRSKASPFYDPEFDHPKLGRSRLEVFDEIEAVEKMGESVMADMVTAELSDDIVQLTEAPETPLTAPFPEMAVERHDPPAPYAGASVARDEAASDPIAEVGEVIGGMIGDLMRRVAELEARLASPSVESEPAESMHDSADNMDGNMDGGSRRTPSRESLIRRYIAMRQRRDLDRRALLAANEYVRKVEAERDALKAKAPPPQHMNEPAPGLVAQVHDERKAHSLALASAENRARSLEAAVERVGAELMEVKGRAIRAEQALQLYRTPGLTLSPYRKTGTAVARVSFGGGR